MKNHRLVNLLKRCREEANISQEELADKLEVGRSYISKVENGHVSSMSYDFVKRWGAATDRSELIGIDLAGDGNEALKKLAVYRLAFMQIRAGIEMLEIPI